MYTIGETLIKPCASKMAGIVLGEESKMKFQQIPLSNDIVQRRIVELFGNIKEQVIAEIKNLQFVLFSIQLDKSADVVSCSQLLVLCRYTSKKDIKDNILFCSALETNTRLINIDVMGKLAAFFDQEGLDWENVCGICTEGASVMLGDRSGLQTLVPSRSPDAVSMHCMIHRQALASETLSESLQDVLNTVLKTVNDNTVSFVKYGALSIRLFKK